VAGRWRAPVVSGAGADELETALSIKATTTRPASRRSWWLAGGMLGLAFGYFIWYTPYAALAKSLSAGLLPGMDTQVGGLVLLPAAALGTLVGASTFLALTGWWRYLGTRRVLGRMMRFPSRTMIIAGFFMALVIATTTLNYTFAGVSILFMLLMMRGGVLVLSPIVDTLRGRRVRVYSWAALAFSLAAVVTALADVDSYTLVIAAVVSLAFYFTGYMGRFEIMSRVAKTGDERTDRRYFAEEAVSAAVWQVLLCAVVALVGAGQFSAALREGFTSFLLTPAVLPAFGIGLLYSALYVYGTLIYLDPREYTWCVPANRCASLLSGLVASFALTALTGIAAPGTGQLIGTGFIVLAITALSYPSIRGALRRSTVTADQPLLLFVCGGNTCRSAMAETIARTAVATNRWRITSAGLDVRPGAPIADEAATALTDLGIAKPEHQARQITPELIAEAHTIYCMTDAHCAAILELVPDAADKTICLDPDGDIPNPHGKELSAYRECATHLQRAITLQLAPVKTG
jgi:protein-tyrosine-phosphatase